MKDLDTVSGISFLHDFNILLRDILKEHSAEQSRQLEAAFEQHQQYLNVQSHEWEERCCVARAPVREDGLLFPEENHEPRESGLPVRGSEASSEVICSDTSTSGFKEQGVYGPEAISYVDMPLPPQQVSYQSAREERITKICRVATADFAPSVNGKSPERRLKCDLLLRFVTGDWFTTFVAMLIVINSVTICVDTDYNLRVALKEYNDSGTSDPTITDLFWIADLCFTTVFTVEPTPRLVAFECTFLSVPDYQWNLLDMVIVLISLMDTVFVAVGLELSYIRVLRLFRIFRTLRVVRTVPLLREAPHHDQRSCQLHLILDLGLDAHCVHHGHVQRRPPPGRDDLHLG